MSTSKSNATLALALLVAIAHFAAADWQDSDPNFVKFKQAMLPKVGHKVTVVGKLVGGKFGWVVSCQDWGIEIMTVPSNPTAHDAAVKKLNGLNKFSEHRVRVVGTLRHSDSYEYSNPLISSIPEMFFFDVAEVIVSDDEVRTDDKAKSQ